MLSITVEYALRAVNYLAQQHPKSCKTASIARASAVPCEYLRKVLLRLREAGITDSSRGVGGGIVLAKPFEQITLYDVARAVEPLAYPAEQIESKPRAGEENLYSLLGGINRVRLEFLKNHTLSSLV